MRSTSRRFKNLALILRIGVNYLELLKFGIHDFTFSQSDEKPFKHRIKYSRKISNLQYHNSKDIEREYLYIL